MKAMLFAGVAFLAASVDGSAADNLFIRVDADGYCSIKDAPSFSCDRLLLELRDVLHVPFEQHIALNMGDVPTSEVKRRQEILTNMLRQLKKAGYANVNGVFVEPPKYAN